MSDEQMQDTSRAVIFREIDKERKPIRIGLTKLNGKEQTG